MQEMQNAKNALRAVIYIRYSSHRQVDSYSVEYQLQECEKYIMQKGYKFINTYIDEAKTAKQTAGRDAFDEMIADAARKKFDRIIVFSFSRSFRNTRDALNYNHELMEKYNVVIESVIERIDLTNPHGKFSGTNLFAMHELQSDIIAAHVRSGMYVAAQQGYFLGGVVPYGYELYSTGELSRGKERKKYKINEEEAKHVRKLYAMYAEGFSINQLHNYVLSEGIKGRKGAIMGINTMASMLRNPIYCGVRDYKIKGHDPIYIPGAVPAIVDEKTWHAVQARHAKTKENTPKRRKGKRLYALTGKIICGKCGSHYFGTTKNSDRYRGGVYAYYMCSKRKSQRNCDCKTIRKEIIENYCINEIKKYILNAEAVEDIAEQITLRADATPTDIEEKLQELKARKTKIGKIIVKLKRDNLEGDTSDETYRELSAEYLQEEANIDLQIYQLEAAQETAISADGVREYLSEMLEDIDGADVEILQVIFDKLIEKVVVHDDKIELYLVVSPFAVIRDNKQSGQPHYKLSLTGSRKNLPRSI